MKKIYWFAFFFLVAVLSGCASSGPDLVRNGHIASELHKAEVVTPSYVQAVGFGTPSTDARTITERRASARNAAIAEAQRRLLQMVFGHNLSSEIRAQNGRIVRNNITSQSRAVLKQAHVVKTEWGRNDGAAVIMRVSRNIEHTTPEPTTPKQPVSVTPTQKQSVNPSPPEQGGGEYDGSYDFDLSDLPRTHAQ